MTSENIEDDYGVIISSVCEAGRAGDILELVSDWLMPSFKTESEEGPTTAKVSFISAPWQVITIMKLGVWLAFLDS